MILLLRKSSASIERERTTANCAQIWWCEAERVRTGRQQIRYLRVPDHEDGDAGWYGAATTRILRMSCRSHNERKILCTYSEGSSKSDV